MAIEFEFYQSPHTFGEKTKKYYPKVVNYRTVTTQELAEEISPDDGRYSGNNRCFELSNCAAPERKRTGSC